MSRMDISIMAAKADEFLAEEMVMTDVERYQEELEDGTPEAVSVVEYNDSALVTQGDALDWLDAAIHKAEKEAA